MENYNKRILIIQFMIFKISHCTIILYEINGLYGINNYNYNTLSRDK